jgi:endo-1,4-beta-xylanase
LDVDDSHLNVQGEARGVAIADVYKRYLDLILGTASVSVVITWGAWDIAKVRAQQSPSGLMAMPLSLLYAMPGRVGAYLKLCATEKASSLGDPSGREK